MAKRLCTAILSLLHLGCLSTCPGLQRPNAICRPHGGASTSRGVWCRPGLSAGFANTANLPPSFCASPMLGLYREASSQDCFLFRLPHCALVFTLSSFLSWAPSLQPFWKSCVWLLRLTTSHLPRVDGCLCRGLFSVCFLESCSGDGPPLPLLDSGAGFRFKTSLSGTNLTHEPAKDPQALGNWSKEGFEEEGATGETGRQVMVVWYKQYSSAQENATTGMEQQREAKKNLCWENCSLFQKGALEQTESGVKGRTS